jgi:hypothetical protein
VKLCKCLLLVFLIIHPKLSLFLALRSSMTWFGFMNICRYLPKYEMLLYSWYFYWGLDRWMKEDCNSGTSLCEEFCEGDLGEGSFTGELERPSDLYRSAQPNASPCARVDRRMSATITLCLLPCEKFFNLQNVIRTMYFVYPEICEVCCIPGELSEDQSFVIWCNIDLECEVLTIFSTCVCVRARAHVRACIWRW